MKTKYEVLSLLRNAQDEFLSGEQLSETLQLSRTSVWKAVKSLRLEGYQIDAVTNKGYRLTEDSSVWSEYEITRQLHTTCVGRSMELLDSVASTNTYLKQYLDKDGYHGHVVISNTQTKGKARESGAFYSPKNNGVYFSVMIKPTQYSVAEVQTLYESIRLAAIQKLEEMVQLPIIIENQSELICRGKKIGGMLTELEIEPESAVVRAVIFGIGVYLCGVVNDSKISSLEQLCGHSFDRLSLLSALLTGLDDVVKKL